MIETEISAACNKLYFCSSYKAGGNWAEVG